MRGKKLLILVVSVCLALMLEVSVIGGCAGPASSPAPAEPFEPVELRFSSMFPSVHIAGVRSQWFMNEITKRTDGAVTFEVFWGAALAPSAGHLELVQKGTVDIVDASVVLWPGKFPMSDFYMCWPLGPTDPALVVRAADQLYKEFPQLASWYANYDIKVVARQCFPYYTILSKTPVRSIEDMKGKKVALIGRFQAEFMEIAGATGVVMPAGERYQALQTGLLDANYQTLDSHYSLSLYEQAKYLCSLEIQTVVPPGLMMNMDSFNSLSPEVQRIILEVGEESGFYMAEQGKNTKDEVIEKMAKAGVTITEFADEDRVEWAASTPDFPAEVAAEMTNAGLPGWEMIERWQEITTELGYVWSRQWGVK